MFLFPGQFDRPFWGGIFATVSPYAVYRLACWRYGLRASLANLTPWRLLVLSLACALASPLLHHVYFAWAGQDDLLRGFLAMFTGDLAGTLVVMYALKGLVSLIPRHIPQTGV